MGTFDTGTGQTGFASEGFREGGGVTSIKEGKAGQPGRIIYKKGKKATRSKEEQPAPIIKEEPQQYTNPQGAIVTKKETSSYPGTRLAQSYKKDLTTEQANRIAQQQGNRRYIAVSSEDVNRLNKDFTEQGYNAKKLVEGMNSGTVTFNKDQEGNITTTSKETITTTETTTGTGNVPAPKEAVEYLNKNYFGVTDYFNYLTAQGLVDTGSGAYNIYKGKGDIKNNIFLLASGKVKTGLGFTGTVAGTVLEPIVYAVSQKRRYDKGIPEAELQSGIYEPIIAKETEQTKAGVIQLSILTQGIRINPAEATPIKTFTPLEKEPYVFIKPYENPFRIPELLRSPEGKLTIAEPTTTIKGGLGLDTNEPLPITKIDFKSLGDTGRKTLTITEPPSPKGTQSQIYPKTIFKEPSFTAKGEAFNPADLPTSKDIQIAYNKQFQGKLSISPSEMEEPELIPKYKQELYKSVTYTEPKPTTITPPEVVKVFRSENPAETQTALKTYIKATSKKTPAPFPEQIVIIEEGTKKAGIFGNKKAQSTVNPFGELELEQGGVYEVSKGGENNKFIFEPGNLGIEATGSKSFIFIPTAIRNEYNFKTGDKSITGTINSARIEFKTINSTNPAIRTETETDQGQSSGIRSITRTNTRSVQKQIQEQIQEQEQDQIIFNPIKVTTNPYKPRNPEPEKPNPTPPNIYKRFKQDNKNKTPALSGYNVFVKQKGLFNKINTKPLNLKSALGLGSETVERTPSATFKITNPENPGGIFTRTTPKGFYKKGNLFIEQPSRRINTSGELFGITSKGRTTKRIKKLYGG